MIPKRTSATVLGGATETFRSTMLSRCFELAGFDPSASGSGWTLEITDTHATYNDPRSDVDDGIRANLQQLKSMPPDQIHHLGDTLGKWVGWGWPGNIPNGKKEVAIADKLFAQLEDLAPTSIILGNHDCEAFEIPLGNFMRTNSEFFDELNHAHTVGGVRFIMISSGQDGAFDSTALNFALNELDNLTADQEAVICTHIPGGSRALDYKGFNDLMAAIPESVTNPLWMIAGHHHVFGSGITYQLAGTTLFQWILGAGGNARWIHFGADISTMAALACRDGKVVGRFAFDGITREWYYVKDAVRSPILPLPGQLDGVAGEDVLSSYLHGSFTVGDHMTGSGLNTWRDTGTWLAHCYAITVHFPIPATATKFWIVATSRPTTMQMSNDGATWTTVTAGAINLSAFVTPIPEALRGGAELYVKMTSADMMISAWGFSK